MRTLASHNITTMIPSSQEVVLKKPSKGTGIIYYGWLGIRSPPHVILLKLKDDLISNYI